MVVAMGSLPSQVRPCQARKGASGSSPSLLHPGKGSLSVTGSTLNIWEELLRETTGRNGLHQQQPLDARVTGYCTYQGPSHK